MSRWACLLLFALVVRLLAGVWWQSRLPAEQRFAFGDSDTYWVLGQAIARGELYQYGSPQARVFRMPGYPALLAPLFWAGGEQVDVLWARGQNALFGTAAVGLVALLARQLFGSKAAWIAGGLAAVSPDAIAASVFILSEGPFGPLCLGHLILSVAGWRASGRPAALGLAAASGVLAGLATLVRPSWLAFLPLAEFVGWCLAPDRRRRALLATVALGGLVATLAPWWIRNAAVCGRFVPTTLQVGASLYDGLNPAADGSSNMAFVPEFERAELAALPREALPPYEFRLDARFRRAAWDWAAAEPGTALKLAAVKFWRMWTPWPGEGNVGRLARVVFAVGYLPVVALGAWGAWRLTGRNWPLVLCWLPAVYLTGLHLIFVSSVRYREPALLPLLVLAAGVLTSRQDAADFRTVR